MRDPANWNVYTATAQPTLLFGRGYTGHEHLNQFGLINMNARLYDPVLGRFYAPDPHVDAPETTNGYNRYVYALNNPMMYVDVNGEDGNLWNYWGGGSYNPGGSSYPNNSQPLSPYSPDFNSPYQGNYNNFNSGSGDYSGFSGNYGGSGNGFGSLVVGFLSSLFNSGGSHAAMKYSGDGAAHAYIKTSPAKAPGGLGVPKVSSGGGNRLGNMSYSGVSFFYGEIKPFQPNIFERINTSEFGKGIIGKVLYGVADDLWITVCSFTIGHERAFHLSGAYTIGDEAVTSGINTITNFLPIGSYGKFAGVGKKTLNAGQFNALMKGTGVTAAKNSGTELRLYNYTIRESNKISTFWDFFGATSTISTYLSTSK